MKKTIFSIIKVVVVAFVAYETSIVEMSLQKIARLAELFPDLTAFKGSFIDVLFDALHNVLNIISAANVDYVKYWLCVGAIVCMVMEITGLNALIAKIDDKVKELIKKSFPFTSPLNYKKKVRF